jgi:hypothetical protein
VDAFDDKGEVGRFPGVIEPGSRIGLIAAPAKDQQFGSPSSPRRFVKETRDVM